MKRKIVIFITAILAIVAISVGSTLAYFIAISEPLTNTFTVGKVDITLTETTGTSYKLTPGATVSKDPKVTVAGGSEDCWLFVKAELSDELSDVVTYTIADGWITLAGHEGVYYRQVAKADTDTELSVLKDDSFSVKDSLDKSKMLALSASADAKKFTFTAYAIQSLGVETATDAWNELQAASTQE